MSARIESRPGVMGGEPCFAGTRVPVAAVLSVLAHGWTWRKVVEEYPSISLDDVRAALEYAAERACDVDRLHAKISELNRRSHAAESAARETVERCRRAGVSLGRSIALWAARDFERRLAAAELKLEQVRELHDCARDFYEDPSAACAVCTALDTPAPHMTWSPLYDGEQLARTISSEVWP